ncbi:MAG: glycerol kinase GlpK [Vicinamibacterales bacterium]
MGGTVSRHHVLAIDQGTSNTKVLLFDERGGVVSRASRPVDTCFPQPGWVEQDALAVWRTVEDAIDACLESAPGASVDAIGISNQRESVLVWDRATGQPLGPVIVWQCRRTAPFCEELRRRGARPFLEQRTGLTIDPLFSAGKFRWLIDSLPDGRRRAANGELCAGTVDSWLVWNLTGGAVHACDQTNASRTQLFNLWSREWDTDVLALFDVPRAMLPEVRPSSGMLGVTIARGRLKAGVPVASAIGDSHAALFGHAAFSPGSVKATYGTGSSLMTLVPEPFASQHGLSTTVAWATAGGTTYALEGNITVTGGAVAWLGGLLGLADPARGVADLARTVADPDGVYLVPALAGLGAPYWDAEARGLLCGATRGTTAAHVARATIDAVAYQVRDVFEAMREDGAAPRALLADGGASCNDDLMQFQADILGCPVLRSGSTDLSAQGAAWLAGLAAGIWPSTEALAMLPREVSRFEPIMSAAERDRRCEGWRNAVARARTRSAVEGKA